MNLRIVCIIKKSETRSPTWSGEIFPSSANILLRKASEPKRGTASPMRRYLWPFVLKTRVTHRGLSSEGERERENRLCIEIATNFITVHDHEGTYSFHELINTF